MSRRAVVSTEDIQPESPPSILMPSDGAIERPTEAVQPLESADKDDYAMKSR
jgi:hypothetical protein